MTVSRLTTTEAELFAQLVAKFEGDYPFDRLTTSRASYLASVLSGLRGRAASELTTTVAELYAGIANALDGGSRSAYRNPVGDCIASSINAAPYHASAVHFDGATWLINASLTATDSKYLSFSMWLRVPSSSNPYFAIVTTDPEAGYNNWMWIDAVNRIFGAAVSGGGHTAGGHTSSGQPYTAGQWLSIIGSFDISAGLNGTGKIYFNGVSVSVDPPGADNDGPVASALWNGLPLWIGADSFDPDQYIGDMADVWIAPGVNLLDDSGNIPTSTLRRFISSTGKPQNPVGFPASAVLLSGNASTFSANQGTGGSFAVTGTLTNAGSSPSD